MLSAEAGEVHRDSASPSAVDFLQQLDVAEVVHFAVTRPREVRMLTMSFRPMGEASAG